MSGDIKKGLVLVIITVYTLFACSYVSLCRRNTEVINLLKCLHLLTASQNASISPVIKNPGHPGYPVTPLFLSRPRVVINKVSLPNLSAVLIIVLLGFDFLSSKMQYLLFVYSPVSKNSCPGIIFLRSRRI
ncbi:MAG: hypothetical protein JWQ66_3516 [Mucilaginibacter sp.]|nr:hypothetical protein [Mucilaginibacter sp.]